MIFAAVTHHETLLILEMEKSLICFSGYTETNSIHSRTTVNFILENVNQKYSVNSLSTVIKTFKEQIIQHRFIITRGVVLNKSIIA
jgi:hypothetical protein